MLLDSLFQYRLVFLEVAQAGIEKQIIAIIAAINKYFMYIA
jgi:hypothetical protein